jgi:hypothetical protein
MRPDTLITGARCALCEQLVWITTDQTKDGLRSSCRKSYCPINADCDGARDFDGGGAASYGVVFADAV